MLVFADDDGLDEENDEGDGGTLVSGEAQIPTKFRVQETLLRIDFDCEVDGSDASSNWMDDDHLVVTIPFLRDSTYFSFLCIDSGGLIFTLAQPYCRSVCNLACPLLLTKPISFFLFSRRARADG